MTLRDVGATLVIVGYLAMIGVTHGYERTLPTYCETDNYYYGCRQDNALATVITSLIWPVWWTSHLTQEALK